MDLLPPAGRVWTALLTSRKACIMVLGQGLGHVLETSTKCCKKYDHVWLFQLATINAKHKHFCKPQSVKSSLVMAWNTDTQHMQLCISTTLWQCPYGNPHTKYLIVLNPLFIDYLLCNHIPEGIINYGTSNCSDTTIQMYIGL